MTGTINSPTIVDLPAWPPQDEAIAEALRQALADGSWGKYHGEHGRLLIERLAEMHHVEQVLLTCSGTAAVELALRGLRVGPGDEVILAAYDFEGNFKNVLTVGARPVLVDIDSHTGQLDVTQLEAARSPQTKAVIASHLHGGVADLPAVRAFADQHQLGVIEDACQMPGARIHGRIAGTWGDIGILSFGGSKLLTAGRGGALFTRDAGIAQRVRLHTQRGNDAYPLSELQAAVLLPQLNRLNERNRIREASVETLLSELTDASGLISWWHDAPRRDEIATQNVAPHSTAAFYKLGFWYDSSVCGNLSRDQFAAAARAAGIPFDPGFRALHQTHTRSRFRAIGDLPNATRSDNSVLVLHHPVLLADADVLHRIVEMIRYIMSS